MDELAAELAIVGVVPDRLADDVAVSPLAREAGDDCVAEQFAAVAVLEAKRVPRLLVPRESREAWRGGTRVAELLYGSSSRLMVAQSLRRVGCVVQRSVLIGLTLILLAGCGGGGTSPSQVAAAVGAATCDNSGFYLQGTSTGAKDAIYDCRFRTGLPKCVTYSGNIASDATAEVSLLFARSLNTRRPVCLKWHAEALHQSQVRAAKRAALKDLYSGLFGNSRKAVTKAEREVGKNPVKGYRDLANALITNNDLPGAIAALRSYLLLRQTDASAWTQLAGCEKQQGDVYAERYQQAQQQSRPSASRLYKRAISYYKDSLAAFQEAANYSPRSELPSAELAVSNAAQLAGQSSVELAALKRYVELAPDSPSLTEIEAACTQLGGSCVPKHKK